MTKKSIAERIEYIKKHREADEEAHCAEDKLYHDFIRYVSRRNDELGKLAKLVLTTTEIEFERWYA